MVQAGIRVSCHIILAMLAQQRKVKNDDLKHPMTRLRTKTKLTESIAIVDEFPVCEAQMQKLLKSKETRHTAKMWMLECPRALDANGTLDVL